jgi:hypothetical protein
MTMTQHQEKVTSQLAPTPYQERADRPRTSPFLVALFVVVGVLAPLLWGAVAWQLLVEVPHATQLFRDFNMKLPELTVWVIQYGWLAALGVFLACVLACALAVPFRRARGFFAALLLFAGVLAPAVLNLTLLFALLLPKWKLMEGLSR